MKLSVICVTQADPKIRPFIQHLASMAHLLGAEMVFGAHGPQAEAFLGYHNLKYVPVEGTVVEEMLDPVIAACTGDYVLRLDDDERCSPGMVHWLKINEWIKRDSWFFSRTHLWPDEQHCLSTHPHYPDFQARLSVKRQARRPVKIHAAHAYPAYRAPALVYIEHHVFLIRSREERQAVTAKYETIRTGQHFTPEQVNYVFPFDEPQAVVAPVGSHLLQCMANDTIWWRQVGQKLPANLDKELRDFRESLSK